MRSSATIDTGADKNSAYTDADVGVDRDVTIGDYVIYRQQPTNSDDSGEQGRRQFVDLQAGDRGLDALVLIGEPIREDVIMSGPFVDSSVARLNKKASVFNVIGRGISPFWCPEVICCL